MVTIRHFAMILRAKRMIAGNTPQSVSDFSA